MLKTSLSALLIVFASAAHAQQAQPPFVPYTISEQEHQAILNALAPLPWAQANPLVQFFLQAEQRAAQKKTAESAPPPVPQPARP